MSLPLQHNPAFLAAHQLQQRLKTAGSFSIGELGFGGEHNFLSTLQLWQALPEPKAQLHYFSFESQPLSSAKLSALDPLLQNAYPPAITGFHVVSIIPGRVTLYLLIGDAAAMLSDRKST